MSGATVPDMFALRQAIIRGVDYLVASAGGTDRSVVAAAAELAARGIPGADAVAREAASAPAGPVQAPRSGSTDPAEPLTGDAVAEILSAQQGDGSWVAIPAPVGGRRAAAAAESRAIATAACLRALAGALPGLSSRPDVETAFWRDGYFVVERFLAPADIETLAQAHRQIHGTQDAGFYTSWFQPPAARAFTDREVRAVMAARLKVLFPGHRMIFGTFMSKGCEGETAFPLHQDPTFVDERTWTPVTFWAPLVDVDERNGCLYAVRGSHLLSADPRLPYVAFPYAEFAERLKACLQPIPMRAGDLLVFHPGLIHASPPNVSGRLRVAAAGAMVPEPAQTFFYRGRENDEAITDVFAVDDSYYVGMAGDDAISETTRVAELRRPRRSLAIERLLSEAEAAAKGHLSRWPTERAAGASAEPPAAAAAADPGEAPLAPADDRSRVSVDPGIRAALAAAVSRVASAWELGDIAREGEALTLNVGDMIFDLRRAKPGVRSFQTVDGIAYSYRGRDLPAGTLDRFRALITHLRPHTRAIDDLLSVPVPPPAPEDERPQGSSSARGQDDAPPEPSRDGGRGAGARRRAGVVSSGARPAAIWSSVRDLPRLASLSPVEFDADAIDLARAARVYADVGFIIVRGLLRSYMEPMLVEIRQAVELAYRELPEAKMERHGLLTPSGGVFSRVGERQLICAPLTLPTSPAMRRYANDPLFVSLLDVLLAHEVHMIGSGQVMYKVANGGVETGLHQDASYTKDFGFKEVVAVFTYVVPTSIERGCIWLVPYSHRLGLLPHQEEGDHAGVVAPGTADWEHAVPIPGSPGDTLLWHFNVLHGSRPNVTAEDRPAVVIRYGRRGDAEVLAEHGLQDW
ncbi:MAG: phytanoyl-CoA dioxygenase family protein [Deltaproteobacteria bacterium]|nr:phytanoyl-CoA dioxygenase family protein [Deltaproteobacteria bacterium]